MTTNNSLLKENITQTVRAINRINLENRKNPGVARTASAEIIEKFVDSTGFPREDLLDQLQGCLENNPEQVELLTMVELLKQYE